MANFRKNMKEYLSGVMELVGASADEKKAADQVAELIAPSSEEAVRRATSFISDARWLHSQLGGLKKEGDGEVEDPEPLDKGEGKDGKVEAVDKEEGKMAQEEKDPKTTAPDAPVLKADEVAVSKAELEALRKQAALAESSEAGRAALAKDVAELKEKDTNRTYIEKAAKYPSLGFESQVLANMIRKMEEGGIKPEEVATHFERMDKQLKESGLLKEKGAAGDGQPGTVRKGATAFESEVQKQVDGLIQKGDKRTPERLFSDVAQQVARDNPELYEAHRAEIAPPK